MSKFQADENKIKELEEALMNAHYNHQKKCFQVLLIVSAITVTTFVTILLM